MNQTNTLQVGHFPQQSAGVSLYWLGIFVVQIAYDLVLFGWCINN